MKAPRRLEVWREIAEEAEKLGFFAFADACRDHYWEEHYRMGIENTIRR